MAGISSPSNKGGPAARQGFKYQDHVAVSFILKMVCDSTYTQVECETADDIVAVFQHEGQTVHEYIQVKTTEGDGKWNWKEVTKLENGRPETSLLQKSLKCDIRPGPARFRIVTKRDAAKILDCFKIELEHRTAESTAERSDILVKKFKKTLSLQQRDFAYWVVNFVWQVYGDVIALESINIKALAKLAENHGNRPSYSQLQHIYDELLELADKAATADVKTEAATKVISRDSTLMLLKQRFEEADDRASANAKPYKKRPDPFLVEFHANTEAGLLRSVSAFDVRYALKQWRCEAFAKHLTEWLPEFSLKASEIVNIQAHNAETFIARSIRAFNEHELPRDKLVAELILHAILRSRENSEPVACKVFYKAKGKLSEFGNAHIVRHPGQQDQLWLGMAHLIEVGDMESTLEKICSVLDATITETALSEEREIVINLREPHHHQPNAEAFNKALHRNAPVDDMLNVLCFPILLTYDSNALSSGWLADYVNNLKTEILAHYGALMTRLPENVEQVKVAVFLVPMESIAKLIQAFDQRCSTLEAL